MTTPEADHLANAAQAASWDAIRSWSGGVPPDLTLDSQTLALALSHAAGVAYKWLSLWHRLALAAGVTPEQVAEIDATPDLTAAADESARKHIDAQLASLRLDDPEAAAVSAATLARMDAVLKLAATHGGRSAGELAELGRSPGFHLKAWNFIASCAGGTPAPSSDDHYLAVWLEGMLSGLYVSYHQSVRGSSREEAHAAYAALIEGQQAIYGALSASSGPEADPESGN